jgi:hypothetical protein
MARAHNLKRASAATRPQRSKPLLALKAPRLPPGLFTDMPRQCQDVNGRDRPCASPHRRFPAGLNELSTHRPS